MKSFSAFLLIAWAICTCPSVAVAQLYLESALLYIAPSATVFVNDSLVVVSDSTRPSQVQNHGNLEIAGNFELSPHSIMSGEGTLRFGGSRYQKLKTYGIPLNSIVVSNDDSVSLGDDLTVTQILTLQKGFITLGNNNMYVSDSVKISGGSDSSYIRINGEGKLIARVDTVAKLFPVGRNPYLPVVISHGGGAEFQIGVHDKVFENPETQAKELTSDVVTETWTIAVDQRVDGVDLQFGWGASQEAAGFSRNASHIAWWHQGASTQWNNTGKGAANGNGPYFQSISLDSMVAGNYFFGIGGSGSPLPVEFGHFTVQWLEMGRSAQLYWATQSELNNSHFEIERSVDARHWEQIGTVEGNGTTALGHSYQFRDDDLPSSKLSTVYYRLKQVDFNGQSEYSPIKTLVLKEGIQSPFSLWPNPASGDRIRLSEVGDYTLMDTKGIIHLQSRGTNELDISALPVGCYVVVSAKGNTQLLLRK